MVMSDTFEISATIRNNDQAIIARQYGNSTQSWSYMPAIGELSQERSQPPLQPIWGYLDQRLILNMLACGLGQMRTHGDGTRTVFLGSAHWQVGNCQYLSYYFMREAQINALPHEQSDLWPYLADIADDTLTTWIDLNASGQAIRAEVRAGTQRSGTLLEGWELVSSELLPMARVP